MTPDPIVTAEEAAPNPGGTSDAETCCRICGLAISPIFGVGAHYDCTARETRRQAAPV